VSRSRRRTDPELASAVVSDPRAFGELYREHEQAVVGYFLHWTRSAELAADLTAETFAPALDSIETFCPDRGELRGWIFGIARHVLARSLDRGRIEDEARRRLGMNPIALDDEMLERIEAVASLDGGALELLSELPPPIRDAVRGRVIEERGYRELAQSLKCSQSVVRQRVHRGLARLRDRLEVNP